MQPRDVVNHRHTESNDRAAHGAAAAHSLSVSVFDSRVVSVRHSIDSSRRSTVH
jgi:hypothetical protein